MSGPRYVYFIKPVGADGPVKIGCSILPTDRLSALTTWSPVKLEIAATIKGDEELERRFHTAFLENRSHAEWFLGCDRLTAVIAQVAAGTFDVSSLPAGRRLPAKRINGVWSDYSRLGASMGARIRALQNRGVSVPKDIAARAFRYNSGRYYAGGPARSPDDAETVQAFLSAHGYAPRPVPRN